jgi:hypothetical protein
LGPERFRGGFAFGAGASAGLSREEVRSAFKMWTIRAIVNTGGCDFFCSAPGRWIGMIQWRFGARMR